MCLWSKCDLCQATYFSHSRFSQPYMSLAFRKLAFDLRVIILYIIWQYQFSNRKHVKIYSAVCQGQERSSVELGLKPQTLKSTDPHTQSQLSCLLFVTWFLISLRLGAHIYNVRILRLRHRTIVWNQLIRWMWSI